MDVGREAGVTMRPESLAPLLLRYLDPETAHHLALRVLEIGAVSRARIRPDPRLATEAAGIRFPSPLGLAAGFDKDARALPGLARLGFGHVEVGTVTPRPQPGNPRPRIFRLPAQQAIINRLGFPSAGLEVVASRLARRPHGLIVGANVGNNRSARDPIADICTGLGRLGGLADYVCVNVSSPNTPGLRDLQTGSELELLLRNIRQVMERVEDSIGRPVPLFLKIAPDLTERQVRDLVERLIRQPVSGVAVSNSTIARPSALTDRHRKEPGGLSGPPLFQPSTRLLARLYGMLPRSFALIGIGGISSAKDAWKKIEAGASLVQLYTGFVYQGAGLIDRIHADLAHRVEHGRYRSVSEAVGSRASEICDTHPHA